MIIYFFSLEIAGIICILELFLRSVSFNSKDWLLFQCCPRRWISLLLMTLGNHAISKNQVHCLCAVYVFLKICSPKLWKMIACKCAVAQTGKYYKLILYCDRLNHLLFLCFQWVWKCISSTRSHFVVPVEVHLVSPFMSIEDLAIWNSFLYFVILPYLLSGFIQYF